MATKFTHEFLENSTKPVIIEAFASWCPHCAKMRPIFAELEKELGEKYHFTEFEIDESKDLTDHFEIKSLPTFIFIKNQREVGREMGEMPKEDLKKFIEMYLK